jgi:hypothetical protein
MSFGRYLLFKSGITSNIGLRISMYMSFICNPSLLVLYLWYFFSVLKCFFLFFFSAFSIFVALSYIPVCPVFNMWFEYPELALLALNAYICFLYLVLNVRPVCTIYFSAQSIYLI